MLAASACTQAEQELQVSVLSSTPALKKKKKGQNLEKSGCMAISKDRSAMV